MTKIKFNWQSRKLSTFIKQNGEYCTGYHIYNIWILTINWSNKSLCLKKVVDITSWTWTIDSFDLITDFSYYFVRFKKNRSLFSKLEMGKKTLTEQKNYNNLGLDYGEEWIFCTLQMKLQDETIHKSSILKKYINQP